MRLLSLVLALLGVAACRHDPAGESGGARIELGGCVITKTASTGTYDTAQLANLGPDQARVCQYIVGAWNKDPEMTGTSAHFNCDCPRAR